MLEVNTGIDEDPKAALQSLKSSIDGYFLDFNYDEEIFSDYFDDKFSDIDAPFIDEGSDDDEEE